jgi:predicted alpha/beta hydrolase family esterase
MRRPSSSAPVAAVGAAQAMAFAGLLLVAGCQSHSAAWDDAWAQCEANAIEQMEFADPDADQRATWRERYIGACMQAKGFSDPQYLVR